MKSSFLHLKKATAFLILVLLGLSLSSCQAVGDPIILSLGIYHQRDFYSEGGFQDFTDYGKYYFKSANADNNAYFTQITSADIPVIHEHLDDFESWIELFRSTDPSRNIVQNYDFDRRTIDTEDLIYLNSEKHTWSDGHTSLVSYNLYFFDSQSLTLYYFHNNI